MVRRFWDQAGSSPGGLTINKAAALKQGGQFLYIRGMNIMGEDWRRFGQQN